MNKISAYTPDGVPIRTELSSGGESDLPGAIPPESDAQSQTSTSHDDSMKVNRWICTKTNKHHIFGFFFFLNKKLFQIGVPIRKRSRLNENDNIITRHQVC